MHPACDGLHLITASIPSAASCSYIDIAEFPKGPEMAPTGPVTFAGAVFSSTLQSMPEGKLTGCCKLPPGQADIPLSPTLRPPPIKVWPPDRLQWASFIPAQQEIPPLLA